MNRYSRRLAILLAPFMLVATTRSAAQPAPDGMGASAARKIVQQIEAPFAGGLPKAVHNCLLDRIADLPPGGASPTNAATVTALFTVFFECKAYPVLGKLEQTALRLNGGTARVDCLANQIKQTERTRFLAVLNAGPKSAAASKLVKGYRAACT